MRPAVLFAMLAACAGPPAPRPAGRCEGQDGGANPCIELGVGPDARPAISADTIEIVHGPQGGWHLEVGARFVGLDPDGLEVAYDVTRLRDGASLGASRFRVAARRLLSEPPALVRAGDIVVLDVIRGDDLVGDEVQVALRVEAAGAEVGSDARTLVVVDQRP